MRYVQVTLMAEWREIICCCALTSSNSRSRKKIWLPRRTAPKSLASALKEALSADWMRPTPTLSATTAAQIPLLEAAAQQTIYGLSVLLGDAPAALSQELSPVGIVPAAPPAVPLKVPSELLRRRPDIRQAEAQIHSATARIGVAVADLYPKFTISGAAGYRATDFSNLIDWSSRFWSFGRPSAGLFSSPEVCGPTSRRKKRCRSRKSSFIVKPCSAPCRKLKMRWSPPPRNRPIAQRW